MNSNIVHTKRILIWLLFLTVGVQCQGQRSSEVQLNYELIFSRTALRTVEVHAAITLEEPVLQMATYGIPLQLTNGWANFVTIKSIKDDLGAKVPFNWDANKKQWRLEISRNSQIQLHYLVELRHDDHNWNEVGGIDGRPSLIGDETIFWVTKGLFIYPQGNSEKKSTITFDVPKDWTVSSPWIKIGLQNFIAKNIDALTNNALMVGKQDVRIINYDGMSITMAVAPNLKHRTELFTRTLSKVLPVYYNVFGELPSANYLICASKYIFEDGEAFYNSFHQLFVDSELESRTIVWGNVLAHEMFHYWNGTNFLVGDDVNANSWFSEGFTEYYANLALVRSGLVTKEEYLQKLAYQFSRFYSSQAFIQGDQPALLEAGYQKSRNWHLIYGGGASIAFILDIEIRHLTHGEKSLDDLMKLLYQNYGKTHKKLRLEHQINALNKLTNADFKPFFNKYVTGKEFYLLPILGACKKAGLKVAQYQGEFFLTAKPNSSMFESLIGTPN